MDGRLSPHCVLPVPNFRVPGDQLIIIELRLKRALLHIPHFLVSFYLLQIFPLSLILSYQPLLYWHSLLVTLRPRRLRHWGIVFHSAP